MAVDGEGRREIVGLHIGPSEAETFWTTFLKGLVKRGLPGVKLVISDAHEGLKRAIRRVMGPHASWQRCSERTGSGARPPTIGMEWCSPTSTKPDGKRFSWPGMLDRDPR